MSAQDQGISINSNKPKINKDGSNTARCYYHKFDDTFDHIVSWSQVLAKIKYIISYDRLGLYIYIMISQTVKE